MKNESGLTFADISSEEFREYHFESGFIVRINAPLFLNVSASGGHRVFDDQGQSHYIPFKWAHLTWKAKEGQPNFVK